MYRSGLTVLLSSLVWVTTVYAHHVWGRGVSTLTTYEWAQKPGPSICVCLEVEHWAGLSLAPSASRNLHLEQDPIKPVTYTGSMNLTVLNSSPNLHIVAQLSPATDLNADCWTVTLVGPGIVQLPTSSGLKTRVVVTDVNFDFDNRHPLLLRVEVNNPTRPRLYDNAGPAAKVILTAFYEHKVERQTIVKPSTVSAAM